MKSIGTKALIVLLFAGACSAQDITGTILIKRRLTRRSVTPSVPLYQRGATVSLPNSSQEDSLAFEQSRVVVYLEGKIAEDKDAATAPTPVAIQQINRQFSPDVAVVPVGSTVSFPNMDPIFHDVYSLSRVRSFDLGAFDKGQTRRVVFNKPGTVEVYCHLHPNMAATILVVANRYYARPGSDGQYRIPNVPPVHYTLVAWHKTAGLFRRQIDVRPGENTSVSFLIPLEATDQQESARVRQTGRGANGQ